MSKPTMELYGGAGKKPVDALMMDGVDWVEGDHTPSADGLPYATHSGVLDVMGYKLRCYRLNDGRTILNADDVNAFFGGALSPDSTAQGDPKPTETGELP